MTKHLALLLLASGCVSKARYEALETRHEELVAQQSELAERVEALEAEVVRLAWPPPAPSIGADADAEWRAADLLEEASLAAEILDYDRARERLAELVDTYGSTRAAKASARLANELEVIGEPAGELHIEKWYQGDVAGLDDGVTLLVFWEVWCPHCKREVPKLQQVSEDFAEAGLTVLGLTQQTRSITDEQVSDFLEDNGITYAIAREDGERMSSRFHVRAIPAAAVVVDGAVVWRGHPARLTDEMLATFLER